MSNSLAAPVALGETILSTNVATHWQGVLHEFKDPYTGGVNLYRLVLNDSGIALLPKRIARYKSGSQKKAVDGYVTTKGAKGAGVVDENLPSAGVPDDHYFWLLVKGVGLGTTSLAADATNVLSEDVSLVAATAATSQATTSGRIGAADYVLTEAALAAQLKHSFGFAVSAKTTANTGVDILCDFDFK